MKAAIATLFIFASDSSSAQYQTLVYMDGTISCECKGWTRRVATDGTRSCKHTRYVEAGMGNQHAIKVVEYSTPMPRQTPNRIAPQRAMQQPALPPRLGRVFDFEE